MLLTLLLLVLIIMFLLRTGALARLRQLVERRRAAAPLPKTSVLRQPSRHPALDGMLGEARRLWESRGRRGQVLLSVIALLLLVLVLRVVPSGGAPSARGQLSVAIAPFSVIARPGDGTGRAVARELVAGLSDPQSGRLTQPIRLTLLNEPVSSVGEAARQADAGGYDVVIWGEVAPGAVADSNSLNAQLLFLPRQEPPTAHWPGLRDRMALPVAYRLSESPLNGLAVLGPLLDALDFYLRPGETDRAVGLLNDLSVDYAGKLTPKLPATLLATIRWSQGDLDAAEQFLHQALGSSRNDPALWNNLGVVLHDRGDLAGAEAAYAQSRQLAGELGLGLAAVHYNLGLLHLGDADPAPALAELERAVELQPERVVRRLTLAIAQRRAQNFDAAAQTLKRAAETAPNDPAVILELARLDMARLAADGDHIEWGLEIVERLPLQRLTELRERFDRAVGSYEAWLLREQQAAARNDVLRRPEAGRVHQAAARRLEALLNEARYWQSLSLIEEGREQSDLDKSMVASLWDSLRGVVSPLQQGRQIMAVLFQRTSTYSSHYQLGRASRLLGEDGGASKVFEETVAQDPNRPDAYYGLALLLWNQRAGSERDDQVRDLLQRAVSADERYYPARRLLARFAMSSESWEEALEQLDWLVANRPLQVDAAISRGTVLGKLGRYAEAEAQLQPLAHDGSPSAMVELALIYRAGGHDAAAEEILRKAVTQNPSYTRASYELARLLHDQGREQAAAAVLEEALELNPVAMQAHLLLGQIYAGPLNQPQQAIEHYQRAIESGGSDPRNYEVLGELFLKADVPEQAVAALERAIALDPSVPEFYHKLALAYLRTGELRSARQAEESALSKAPDGVYPAALAGLGDSYRLEGEYELAVQHYSRALEQNSQLVEAYIGLGQTAAAQGHWQISMEHYHSALEIDPQSTDAHYWLATALLESGNYESALREFQMVLDRNPEYVEAYYGAGKTLANIGSHDEALGFYREALRRRPAYAEALLARGKLLQQMGQLDAALADLRAAAEADPRLAEPLYLQGLIFIGRNDFGSAVQALEEAVVRQDNFAEAHYWLGRAYRALNRNEDAYRRFAYAVELQPGYTEARYFLAVAEEERGNRAAAIAAYEAVAAQAPAESPWRVDAQHALERLR